MIRTQFAQLTLSQAYTWGRDAAFSVASRVALQIFSPENLFRNLVGAAVFTFVYKQYKKNLDTFAAKVVQAVTALLWKAPDPVCGLFPNEIFVSEICARLDDVHDILSLRQACRALYVAFSTNKLYLNLLESRTITRTIKNKSWGLNILSHEVRWWPKIVNWNLYYEANILNESAKSRLFGIVGNKLCWMLDSKIFLKDLTSGQVEHIDSEPERIGWRGMSWLNKGKLYGLTKDNNVRCLILETKDWEGRFQAQMLYDNNFPYMNVEIDKKSYSSYYDEGNVIYIQETISLGSSLLHSVPLEESLLYDSHNGNVYARSEGKLYQSLNGNNGEITVLDLETREQMPSLVGHTNSIWSLRAVNGELFSASQDQTVRRWDLKTHRLVAVFTVDSNPWSLTVDNEKLYVRAKGGIYVWDLKTNKFLGIVEHKIGECIGGLSCRSLLVGAGKLYIDEDQVFEINLIS